MGEQKNRLLYEREHSGEELHSLPEEPRKGCKCLARKFSAYLSSEDGWIGKGYLKKGEKKYGPVSLRTKLHFKSCGATNGGPVRKKSSAAFRGDRLNMKR